ncbi:MAG: (Fe-S)-binding protein [Planctomycetota bacterium]
MSECIHCGFCLSSCPTFVATKRERSGPRGRIALMAQGDSQALRTELDFCLGCLACTSACPAGVDYGELLENARVKTVPRWRKLLLRLAFGGPRRMRLLRPWPKQRIEEIERPVGKPRMRVGLLTGCVQDQWFRQVNRDSVDALLHHGCEVVTPKHQGCCGALHAHQGDPEYGRTLAGRLHLDADVWVSNAGGCGAHLKRLGLPVRDIHELLMELGIRETPPIDPVRVAYHDACHLAHGQGIRSAPRELLRAVPGLELVDLEGADECCGAAGVYFLLQPRFARELRSRKRMHIRASGAALVAAANPGCQLQLRGARHPVSIYMAALRRTGHPG